jgi:hypothetical protein
VKLETDMDLPDAPELLLEALSDKVLHQLPPAVWQELFLGEGRRSIRFREVYLCLVHADSEAGARPERRDFLARQLQELAARHHGLLDAYVAATALASFEDAESALQMAIALQRLPGDWRLRIGVVSGLCTLALFDAGGRTWCTPIGALPERAASVAATAAAGSIAIAPETYTPMERQIQVAAAGCLLTEEFHDSDLAHACITFAPDQGAGQSTFAGLGLTTR